MPTFQFPSISGRQIGYAFHTDSMALWDSAYRSVGPLGPSFGEFPTYGDGLTRHGSEYAVTKASFGDYCASLASFLLSAEPTQELRDSFRYLCADRSSRETIEFALSVQFKAGGKAYRYFNVLERKVSTREALQHDKRWHSVKEVHDGTVDGARVVLMAGDSPHDVPWLFEQWSLREEIRRVANERDSWSVTTARYFLRDRDQHEASTNEVAAGQAFDALRLVCESMRMRDDGARQLDCFKSNTKIVEAA